MTATRPTVPSLTVLVVGVEDWGIEQAAAALGGAGHTVLRCHEPGEPAFPCNALIPDRTCPLAVGFHVALTVRTRPAPPPAPGEMGVICALSRAIPLVVAGVGGDGTLEGLATTVVPRHDSVVSACEDATVTTGLGPAGW
jgi:hypothetical protein